MTKVVFETATIADAIKKAARIAPGKGKAFDKAAGIVLEISPGTEAPVVVRATNLDIFSMEWVDAVEATGPSATWRLPSQLLAQVIGSLPIGSGLQTTFEEIIDAKGHSFVQVTNRRTKAKFNMMRAEDFPAWSVFDPDTLYPCEDLGGRIDQVEWAAAKSDNLPILSGIYFDGSQCLATDRYRLAAAELKIPDLQHPVAVPAGLLGQILKQTGEVMVGIDGGQFLIMPDEHTQIRCVLYGQDYPKVERIMVRDKPNKLIVKKAPLLEVISRANAFTGSDRFPTLRVYFGKEEIAVMMNNEEIGLLGDVVEVPGHCLHERFEIKFTPKNLVDAITKSPNEEILLGYDISNPKATVYVDGGSGYEAWVMPRGDANPE